MSFNENKYVGVKEMVSADLVDVVTKYALMDEMIQFSAEGTDINNAQVPDAHSKYADTLMEALLLHIHPKMEHATGLTLLPTYSYFRVYRPGQDLKPHIDRPACEISTTISFNFNYLTESNKESWPIWVQGKDGPKSFSLDPGDAVIYRGCEIEHWRNTFDAPEYSYHVQGFFHYVDANGPFKEESKDRRLFIGQPKQQEVAAQKDNNSSNKSYISNII